MAMRREFLKQTAGVLAATSLQIACTPRDTAASKPSVRLKKASHIQSVVRREETALRLGGAGDNWHMSWGADDRQLVAVCDGMGWSENPKELYNNRLLAISAGPRDATFHEIPAYPEKTHRENTHSDGKPGIAASARWSSSRNRRVLSRC